MKLGTVSTRKSLLIEGRGMLKELNLSLSNAAVVIGETYEGTFQVGNLEYTYFVQKVDSPYPTSAGILTGNIVNVGFYESEDSPEDPGSFDRKKKTGNLVKILSTMYKVLHTLVEEDHPDYIILFAKNATGYFPIYSELTQTNKLPGYTRKAVIDFEVKEEPCTGIILKKVGKKETLTQILN